MSEHIGPPPPPQVYAQVGAKTPWYKKWWGGAIIAVLVLGSLNAAFGGDEAEEPQAAPAPTTAEEMDEPQPEPEPEPEPRSSTGDWPSVEIYSLDVLDSLESTSELFFLYADGLEMWEYGFGTDRDILELGSTFRDVLYTHIEYFDGTTAPDGFQRSQDLLVGSWELAWEGSRLFDEAIQTGNLSTFDRALDTFEAAADMMEDAANAFPF